MNIRPSALMAMFSLGLDALRMTGFTTNVARSLVDSYRGS